jgi:DNA repair photolyase
MYRMLVRQKAMSAMGKERETFRELAGFFDTVETDEVSYNPRPAPLFRPQRIVLTKGSVSTPRRRSFVDRICAVYPRAEVVEQLDRPHNKVDLGTSDPLTLHDTGRRTLVVGEHQSALRRSTEENNTCPNFWHFSPYGFCPYGCGYCYLAGTQGVRFSPTVKIYVNLDAILRQIDRKACEIGRPEAFYLGKLQDGMALDPLTGYSRLMIPFFAEHPLARLRILSKSADFANVLDLDHRGHTVLSWSLNPAAIRQEWEATAPPVEERIEAMRQCAAAGYPVRVVLMPIIPIPDWQRHYDELLEQLLTQVDVERISLGGVCSYGPALRIMEGKLGKNNVISRSLSAIEKGPDDGRVRYTREQRKAIYCHLLRTIRRHVPDQTCALCMEDVSIAEELNLFPNAGRCNCIL